jgi:1,2-dihydroxy-3-keto-5-methylthiopentene dioxygenase
MAILHCPDTGLTLDNTADVKAFLDARGILFEQWNSQHPLSKIATQEEVLDAYAPTLNPYMQSNNYKTADVVSINEQTPNIEALRTKFLPEHTHTEDEVRFFIEGQGDFWFNLANEKEAPFMVQCHAGDLLAVPAGYPHWFDFGENPSVRVIRIFTDASGWTPHYTHSDIHARYCPV